MWRKVNLKKGVIYRQFLTKVVSSLLCASKPPDRLGKVLFLAVSPGDLLFWLCRQILVYGCVVKLCSQAVLPEVVLVVAFGPGFPGCVIKGWSRTSTALLSSVTAVQQGFIMRGSNIDTSSESPFVDEVQ